MPLKIGRQCMFWNFKPRVGALMTKCRVKYILGGVGAHRILWRYRENVAAFIQHDHLQDLETGDMGVPGEGYIEFLVNR